MTFPTGTEVDGEIPYAGRWYDKGAVVFNVMHPDFGATGNGSTDDTAAIQAAIDAAEALKSGGAHTVPVVYLPQGFYLISSSLTMGVTNRIIFTGASMFATRLQVPASGFSSPVLAVGSASVGTNNVELRNFGVNCLNQAGTAAGISILRQDRMRIDQVEVATAAGPGILMSNSTVDITRSQFSGNGTDGILIRSSTSVWITRCLNNGNGVPSGAGYSFRVEYDNQDITGTPTVSGAGDVNVTIRNCHSESDKSGAVLISAVENVKVEMNQFQLSGTPGIDVTGASKNCSIMHNYWRMSTVDSLTSSGSSVVEAPAIRFSTASVDNIHGFNTIHAGSGLRVRVQDSGLNYSLDHDRFTHKAFMLSDGGAPTSGWAAASRTNVALHSEDLTDAVWVAAGSATISNVNDVGNPYTPVAASGSATRVVFPSGTVVVTLTQTVTGLSVVAGDRLDFGLFVNFGSWSTSAAAHDFGLRILNSADEVLVDRLWKPTADWERYIASYISTGSHSSIKIQYRKQVRNTAGAAVYLWGASLVVDALGVTPYLPTGASTQAVDPGHVALRYTASKSLNIGFGTDIVGHLSAIRTWNPASLADGASDTTTLTVTGAAKGDTVVVGFENMTDAKWQLTGYVTSTNTVTVTVTNHTGGTVDLASGTLRADVWKH